MRQVRTRRPRVAGHRPPPKTHPPAMNAPLFCWHSRARSASRSAQARRVASCSAGDSAHPKRPPPKSTLSRIPRLSCLMIPLPYIPNSDGDARSRRRQASEHLAVRFLVWNTGQLRHRNRVACRWWLRAGVEGYAQGARGLCAFVPAPRGEPGDFDDRARAPTVTAFPYPRSTGPPRPARSRWPARFRGGARHDRGSGWTPRSHLPAHPAPFAVATPR